MARIRVRRENLKLNIFYHPEQGETPNIDGQIFTGAANSRRASLPCQIFGHKQYDLIADPG